MEYIFDYLRPIVNTIHFILEFEDENNKSKVNMFDLLNMKAPGFKKVLIVDIKNNNEMFGVCAWAQTHGYQYHVTRTNIFPKNTNINNHFYDACTKSNSIKFENDILYNTIIIGYHLANYIQLDDLNLEVCQDDIDFLQEIPICHIKSMFLNDFLKIYQTPNHINMM
ncbi:hypothetical protein QJ854_gp163 [Moumouvirus goulette]|uniref:DUF5894 domain-containing protein n=1 Tax=Moumouvirus goulette TaxID=1247379 RepID=M1PCC4_9VIRU|nr:hypothetical protein QJ854_gp163 [Moumouvirus goulette]AGF85619.1 hypothetical protein glt_00814 [Moumouvirus goulette]